MVITSLNYREYDNLIHIIKGQKMKKCIYSLLSVLTLMFVLTGCNTSEGSSRADGTKAESTTTSVSSEPASTIIVNGNEVATNTNSFGISAELGTPPERPAQ